MTGVVEEEGYVSGKEDIISEHVDGRTVNRKQGKKRAKSGEFYKPMHMLAYIYSPIYVFICS